MKNTLLYRLGIFNALAALWLVGTDFGSGWFRGMLAADTTYISYGIILLFLAILGSTWYHALSLNKEVIDSHKLTSDYEPKGEFRMEEISHIHSAAGWMFIIGLIGTLFGLGISLSGVSLDNLLTADGLRTVAVQLIAGLRIEIGVTIIGAMFGVITEMNYASLRYTAAWLTWKDK